MTTPENAPVAITLGQEELFYLMRILKFPSLPGLNPRLMDQVEAPLLELLMAAAQRSLRAKGFVKITSEGLEIEQAVLGILGFCARDPRSLIVSRTPDNEAAETAVYHLSPRLRVKHHEDRGVHHFTLVPEESAILSDIMRLVNGGVSVPATVPENAAELPARSLIAARVLAVLDDVDARADALRTLQEDGFSAEDIRQLETFMREALIAAVSISYAVPAEKAQEIAASSFSALQTRYGWYAMQLSDPSYELYRLEPLSGKAMRQTLTDFVRGAGYPA